MPKKFPACKHGNAIAAFARTRLSSRRLAIKGKPADGEYELAGGTLATGEFAGVLLRLFRDPASSEYRFKKWETVLGHPAALYSYRVPAAAQPYELRVWDPKRRKLLRQIVGLRGEVTIDRASHGILRVSYQTSEVPLAFPLSASTDVEYDYVVP